MAVDEASRHRLYQRLEEVLGSEEATTLIQHLPPVGWADVATKGDLAGIKSDLDELEQRMDLRFENLEMRLTGTLDRRISELQHRLTLQMVAINGGSILSVAALAFAAARLT